MKKIEIEREREIKEKKIARERVKEEARRRKFDKEKELVLGIYKGAMGMFEERVEEIRKRAEEKEKLRREEFEKEMAERLEAAEKTYVLYWCKENYFWNQSDGVALSNF